MEGTQRRGRQVAVRRVPGRWWAVLGVIAAIVVFFATLSLPQDASRLFIFFTATAHANLEPCGCPVNPSGGVSRRAAFIRSHTPPDTPVLLLDGGDVVGPPTPEGLIRSEFMFRAMEEMGYSVLGLGARDFSFGPDFLRFAEKYYGFTFVGTNLLSSRTHAHLFAPYAIALVGNGRILGIPFGGLRVGVLSVMGRDLIPFIPDTCEPAFLLDPLAAVRTFSRRIRSQCDLVAVLAYTDQALLDSLVSMPGVDIVIAARTLNVPPGYTNVGMRGRAALAYTGYEARRIGVMRIRLDSSRNMTEARGDLITLSENLPEDETVRAMVQESRRAVAALPNPGSLQKEPPAQ